MPDPVILLLLFGAGALTLVAEIFLPSHGVLTVVGVGLLLGGVVNTFVNYGEGAGVVSLVATLLFVPAMALVAIRYFHRTPIGKLIAPPNPVLTDDDIGVPVEELEALLGQVGQASSPLRPVGICVFNGRRVSCVTKFGLIEAGTAVEAIGISGGNLEVAEKRA